MVSRILIFVGALVLLAVSAWSIMIRMPGKSFHGPPPPLTAEEKQLRDELRADVQKIAGGIGERNLERYPQLIATADFIESKFADAGLGTRREAYEVEGKVCPNIEAEIRGTNDEIVIVGAHYDTVPGSPGANDNGSGVAGMLALARHFAGKPTGRTLRFVAFPNEEPTYFQTHEMGSWKYASECKARGDRVAAMISLETIGYYSSAPESQNFPVPWLGGFYPSAGNFIAFVGSVSSGGLVRKAIGGFRQVATIPSEGAALPATVPGVGWSDHWAFWQHGYPAMMLTDTAPFRYPHYHARTDTPDKLDYDSMARVIRGMENVVVELARPAH